MTDEYLNPPRARVSADTLRHLTAGEIAARVCPPCNGDCDQGDTCPARAQEPEPDTPAMRAFDKAWLLVGLILLGWIAVCMVVGAVAAVARVFA